jgi:hypothetical protein
MGDDVQSGGFQQAQYGRSAAKEVESAAVGGDMLMLAGAGAEEVTQLIVGLAEPASGTWTLEPTHRPVAAFDAAVILL